MNAAERAEFNQLTRTGKVLYVLKRYLLLLAIALPVGFLVRPVVSTVHRTAFYWACDHGISRDERCLSGVKTFKLPD